MNVVYSEASRADILGIEDCVGRDSPRAAMRLGDRIRAACEGLGTHPQRYARSGLADLRMRPVGQYLIFYRVTDHVEIIRVLHGARDWQALLEG